MSQKIGIEILNKGTGTEKCPKGAKAFVHYTGQLEDGTVFDSSRDRGVPLDFKVGMGMVIPCWDIGIQQLVKGQQANLTCPSHTAYGSQGIRGVIPPNATLKFNVELVDFKK